MRVRGWEQALHAVTRRAMRRAYSWGEHDCALFAADCVAAVTGEDFAADFRGRYSTEEEAQAVLASLGCASVADLPGRFGLPECLPTEARRGDVVLIPGAAGEFLGIVDGRTAVGPGPRGLAHVPLSGALKAWRV